MDVLQLIGSMKKNQQLLTLCPVAGHFTIAAHRSNSADRAMPPWATVSPDLDLVCRLHQRLSDVCDVQEIDIVVVGIFHQVCQLAGLYDNKHTSFLTSCAILLPMICIRCEIE